MISSVYILSEHCTTDLYRKVCSILLSVIVDKLIVCFLSVLIHFLLEAAPNIHVGNTRTISFIVSFITVILYEKTINDQRSAINLKLLPQYAERVHECTWQNGSVVMWHQRIRDSPLHKSYNFFYIELISNISHILENSVFHNRIV